MEHVVKVHMSNNNNNILYLFTIKSESSAPFTGDYKSANF